MNQKNIFTKNVTLLVIGQIISLFGNAILRFALPLYLLNKTHSAMLFGLVSACSFIPMIVLSLAGGIIADRVNKRNIMVILDFCTASLIIIVNLLLGKVDLVLLIVSTLIILYGIQGTYQPAVQASIPALIDKDRLIVGNSVINLVTSLANLIGPVIGGAVFGFWGINPILLVSICCFLFSAFMELFINIPYQKQRNGGNILEIISMDIKESRDFIRNKQPILGKIAILLAAINFFFSSLLIIGLPIVIIHNLGFEENLGNQLYGYCEGAYAAGGLIGGILAGTLLKKFKIANSYILIFICSVLLTPIGFATYIKFNPIISYSIIVICCFISMGSSTIFSINMVSYGQTITPSNLVGKIMSIIMCICMCAFPLGQAIYGVLIEFIGDNLYFLFFGSSLICCAITYLSKGLFKNLDNKKIQERKKLVLNNLE